MQGIRYANTEGNSDLLAWQGVKNVMEKDLLEEEGIKRKIKDSKKTHLFPSAGSQWINCTDASIFTRTA